MCPAGLGTTRMLTVQEPARFSQSHRSDRMVQGFPFPVLRGYLYGDPALCRPRTSDPVPPSTRIFKTSNLDSRYAFFCTHRLLHVTRLTRCALIHRIYDISAGIYLLAVYAFLARRSHPNPHQCRLHKLTSLRAMAILRHTFQQQMCNGRVFLDGMGSAALSMPVRTLRQLLRCAGCSTSLL